MDMVSFRASWRAPQVIAEEHFARLEEVTLKAYAQALVAAPKQTSATGQQTLKLVYPPAEKLSENTRNAMCKMLNSHHVVLAEVARLRDEQFRPQLMGKIERRATLASVVRTTLTDVVTSDGTLRTDLTPEQQRAIKKVKTRTTDGETTHEIELFDPLAAARLDAELDGTLSRGGASTMVQVNVNTQESFEQKVQRLIGAEKTEAPATLPPDPAITLIDPMLE